MKPFGILIVMAFTAANLQAQVTRSTAGDTTVQNAQYNRPGLQIGSIRTAIGGYVEANTNYHVEDGITEGFGFEMRRFNLFVSSSILPRVRFLSELEFEHGTEEILLETAILDIDLLPALTFRMGVMLTPIGRFNQDHDAPKWDFVDRPLVSTTIIPTTLSEVGLAILGDWEFAGLSWTYIASVTNGLDAGVTDNETGRTSIPHGKNPELFEEDPNGSPMFAGRIAASAAQSWEIGLSAYGGTYNRWRIEGEAVQAKRNLGLFALDAQASWKKFHFDVEAVVAAIQIGDDQSELHGTRQWGLVADLRYRIKEGALLGFEQAAWTAGARFERVDYHAGDFANPANLIIDPNVGDDITSMVAMTSFRPGGSTVIRLNYRYSWIRDALKNPMIRAASLQFGVASYF